MEEIKRPLTFGWIPYEGGFAASAVDTKGSPLGVVYVKNSADPQNYSVVAYDHGHGAWKISRSPLHLGIDLAKFEAESTLSELLDGYDVSREH